MAQELTRNSLVNFIVKQKKISDYLSLIEVHLDLQIQVFWDALLDQNRILDALLQRGGTLDAFCLLCRGQLPSQQPFRLKSLELLLKK